MSFQVVFYSVLIALAFVSWPIIGRYSNAEGAWVSLITMAFSTITILVLSLERGNLGAVPNLNAILLLSFGGFLNGWALYQYSYLIANPNIPTGILVLIVSIFGALFAPLLGWLVLKQVLTLKQVLGIVMAIVAIYLLKP